MTRVSALSALLATAIAMPALADAPVVTAPPVPAPAAAHARASTTPAATTADPGVAQQIDDFIRSSPAELPADHASGVISGQEISGRDGPDGSGERQVHGVVSVGVGTGGYRSFYARSDMPVGKSGTLSIAVADEKGRGGYWGGPYSDGPYGGPYGGRPYLGGRGYGGGYGQIGYGRSDRRSLDVGLSLGDQRACRGRDGERDPLPPNAVLEIRPPLGSCDR